MAGEGLNTEEMGPNGLGFRVLSPVEKTSVINKGYGGIEEIKTVGYSMLGTAMPLSRAQDMCRDLNDQLKLSNNSQLRKMKAKIVEDRPVQQK